MLRDIRTLVPNDVVGQILLLGEAGSGKSHLVGYVHRHIAQVQQRTLNRVRCQNVTLAGTGEEMQSKALFGTTEATGVKDTPGAFQDVEDGGLLFLDEIGELTASSQSDLLGALQPVTDTDGTRYRDVRRMGARKGIKSRCFVLAATNRDLEAMANEGQFNEALLQRFANKQVQVPPLRDRKSDLPLLIEHFVEGACRQYQVPARPKLEVSPASWDRYADAHAIRQLAALIEGTISRNRFKTLLTEKDFFGDMPVSIPVSLVPNPKLQAPPTSPSASTNVVVKTPGTVSALVSHLDSWIPEITMDPREFEEAFVRLDAAFGKAKLRLWRDLVERQKSLAGAVNLLATARQLLGRPQIVSSKSGDLAAQTFMEAGIAERPSDPVLAEIWDRRRVSKRSLKDRPNEPED